MAGMMICKASRSVTETIAQRGFQSIGQREWCLTLAPAAGSTDSSASSQAGSNARALLGRPPPDTRVVPVFRFCSSAVGKGLDRDGQGWQGWAGRGYI